MMMSQQGNFARRAELFSIFISTRFINHTSKHNNHGASTDTNGVIKDAPLIRSTCQQPPHSIIAMPLSLITHGEKSLHHTNSRGVTIK